jgi:hypothetical protein
VVESHDVPCSDRLVTRHESLVTFVSRGPTPTKDPRSSFSLRCLRSTA